MTEPEMIADPLPYRGGDLRYTPAVDDACRAWGPILHYVTGLARNYGLLSASLSAEGERWFENQARALNEVIGHLGVQERTIRDWHGQCLRYQQEVQATHAQCLGYQQEVQVGTAHNSRQRRWKGTAWPRRTPLSGNTSTGSSICKNRNWRPCVRSRPRPGRGPGEPGGFLQEPLSWLRKNLGFRPRSSDRRAL